MFDQDGMPGYKLPISNLMWNPLIVYSSLSFVKIKIRQTPMKSIKQTLRENSGSPKGK